MTRRTLVAVVLFAVVLVPLASADSLEELSQDFWQWRAAEQPFTADDLVRIERPAGWVPDWSPKVVENYRRQLGTFEARWVKLRDRGAPIPRQVDYSLIGSALARVRWELDLNRTWQRHPGFYVDQTMGAYVHLILEPAPPSTRNEVAQSWQRCAPFPRSWRTAKRISLAWSARLPALPWSNSITAAKGSANLSLNLNRTSTHPLRKGLTRRPRKPSLLYTLIAIG